MKTNKNILFTAMFSLMLVLFACQPDEYELGSLVSVDDLSYSITQNADDPNMIYLESKTDGYTPLWVTPQGRSSEIYDTLKMPFAGDYFFVYAVLSDGGIVYADTFELTLTTNNLSYVTDELWTFLTGGVGSEKSWVADNGNYGMAEGAMSYANPSETVEWNDFTPNWEPEGNAYGSTDDEMGWGSYMTFGLINDAVMKTYKLNEGGSEESPLEEEGTFYLDVDNHTISTTDVTILRCDIFVDNADNWSKDLKVLTLTENQLQIAVLRTNDEGEWWYIWNYVSKDYADNYVPEDTDPVYDDGYAPEFEEGELLELLTGGTGTARKWKLDVETNAIDWVVDGVGWTSSTDDSRDWGWNDGWDEIANDSWIMFDQFTGKQTYTRSQEGVETSGTFTIYENEETGLSKIILSGDSLIQNTASWFNPTSDTIAVVKAWPDNYEGGGIWLGAKNNYDASSNKWMVFHYIVDGELPTTSIAVDNSKILFGDLEGNGNFRIEIYNDYGSGTASDPPINTDDLVFSNGMTITFTLSGITYNEGAAGSYAAWISYSDPDWSPSYWGDGTGDGDTTVSGDGTYTVSFAISGDAEGANVFVIDCSGMGTDISDIDAVTATIDEILIY